MKNKSNMSSIRKNFLVLKYIFKFCPHLIYYAIVYVISRTVKSLSSVLLITNAINAVIKGGSESNIHALLSSILVYVIIIVVCSIINVVYNNYINPKYHFIFKKNIQHFLYSKVKNIDMESFDDPEFFDRFNRASTFCSQRGYRVYNTIMDFIVNFVTMLTLGTFIIIKDPFLLLIILICSIINLLVITFNEKMWYKLYRKNQNDFRYKWYVSRTFYNRDNAAELKATPIDELLVNRYDETCKDVEKNYKKAYRKICPFFSIYYIVDVLISQAGTYALLTYRLLKGLITVSNFTATINATVQFASNVGMAVSLFSDIKENSLYINDFLWVLDYKPVVEKDKERKDIDFKQLDIENVSFSYPKTDKNQIDNLSISIKKGERIAIVGENGGGKTTLMKLLLDFYEPKSGDIKINGISYKDLSNKQIREMYSIVFQDFKIYATTIIENILMIKVKCREDYDIALDALDKVGLKEKVLKLDKGLDTLVTKEFDRDGITFSGGERQRLVIARVFASNRDIYILDEPTSALDPIAEERINKLIINSAKDKTMFIIAHRLSTVVDADKIYLINNGKVVEAGTHEELMKKNGSYANMFNTQKHLYEKIDD